ncbi:hypothetical protein [Corynebacterium pseudokroppenstedtii]|uniref:hypothetical protein n=1 Tax=Corynebacterium pseudokroppenstedtii TaxID=2804917 RepID=UPI00254DEBF8|nr:hypothetical protein [Corynebacterium pseudokroppenstedtii]MDK7148515.1 hypothetical protein [Corynebacterium pseudokroppenstedtii]
MVISDLSVNTAYVWKNGKRTDQPRTDEDGRIVSSLRGVVLMSDSEFFSGDLEGCSVFITDTTVPEGLRLGDCFHLSGDLTIRNTDGFSLGATFTGSIDKDKPILRLQSQASSSGGSHRRPMATGEGVK